MSAVAGVAQASHVLRPRVELEWHEHAACRGTEVEFYPERGGPGSSDAAKRVCRVCPVRGECLQYAIESEESFGIWGGFNQAERRVMRRARRAQERKQTQSQRVPA